MTHTHEIKAPPAVKARGAGNIFNDDTSTGGHPAMQNIAILTAEHKGCLQEPEAGANVGLPPGLDPVRHSIILLHWFGRRPVGAVAAQVVQDLAFRRSRALASEQPIGTP